MKLIDNDYAVDTAWSIEVYRGSAREVCEMLEDAPTVDAVPVRHGKWVQRYIKIGGQVFKHGMQCSVCAEPALDNEGDDYLTNYCPNCGARMDGERKEE